MEDYRKIAIELGQTLINKAPETREDVERMLPELKESEDEKIRKAIKYGLDHVFTNNTTIFEVTKEQCLAWLEKQGKQKLINPTLEEKDKMDDAFTKMMLKDEQKIAKWSKEDERHVDTITSLLEYRKKEQSDWGVEVLDEEIAWLKSLRPLNRWKPSDEQMAQLQKYCPDNRLLTSLYEQLKKLREE